MKKSEENKIEIREIKGLEEVVEKIQYIQFKNLN